MDAHADRADSWVERAKRREADLKRRLKREREKSRALQLELEAARAEVRTLRWAFERIPKAKRVELTTLAVNVSAPIAPIGGMSGALPWKDLARACEAWVQT